MLLVVQCSFDKCRFLPTCTCLNLIFYLPCQWSSFFESAAERLLYCCLVTKYSLLMLLWHKALILLLTFPYFFNLLNKSHTHPWHLCMHLFFSFHRVSPRSTVETNPLRYSQALLWGPFCVCISIQVLWPLNFSCA